MPAQSEAQRRYLYSRFGAAWVKRHHFNNDGPLPAHKGQAMKQVVKVDITEPGSPDKFAANKFAPGAGSPKFGSPEWRAKYGGHKKGKHKRPPAGLKKLMGGK